MTPLPSPPTFNGPVDAPTSRQPGADSLPVPDGYRLVKVETLIMLQKELQRLKRGEIERDPLPKFLERPRQEFLRATERGTA